MAVMEKIRKGASFQQLGLVLVILFLAVVNTRFAGSHLDHVEGRVVNNFLNASTLLQIFTDTSFFAIMAVGMTAVIVSAGIDLSVGSIYALCGVSLALLMRANPGLNPVVALVATLGIGVLAGLINGTAVASLGVHPFIITLGTMWIYRGVAFVATKAESILVPESMNHLLKTGMPGRPDLHPVATLAMLAVVFVGGVYLTRTVYGRRIFAVGGNVDAARYSALPIGKILCGVYVVSGLTAGVASFLSTCYYGSASSGDGQGYELYVIASAVVGGASLTGGKGTAIGAFLGALLIVMIRQSIRTLRLDSNYEWIIIGFAIIIAVVFDRLSARRRKISA
jgi:ribose transport system permease protein